MAKAIATHSVPRGGGSVCSLCPSVHTKSPSLRDLHAQKEGTSEAEWQHLAQVILWCVASPTLS